MCGVLKSVGFKKRERKGKERGEKNITNIITRWDRDELKSL
jgi:hypothetical protein